MATVDDAMVELIRRAVRAELAELLPQLRPAPAPAARLIDQLLTVDQVAKLCRSKSETVRGWCLSGQLVGRKAGRRWVVRREDLERFLVDRKASQRATSPASAVDEIARKIRAAGGRR